MTSADQFSSRPGFREDSFLPAWIALGASAVVLALLYAFNPYATGYGETPISVLQFASTLWKEEDWQHCFLVPAAVVVMVYFRRRNLLPQELGSAWWGLPVAILGLAVYWLGFRADNIYLGYASFQVLTAGMILWLFGWRWFQHLFFAWGFLIFLYPVPFLDNLVAFPLRMVMSEASVTVLNVIGIDSIKTGSAILSAPDTLTGLKTGERFSVDVADPCSGIRSLFALMMVSALYGYFTQPGFWRKIVMFLCSMPLAVLGNLARILMLVIGTLAIGEEAAIGPPNDPSFFHMMAGFLVFGVALAGLIGVGWLLNADWPELFARLRETLQSHSAPRPVPARAAPARPRPPRVHEEY